MRRLFKIGAERHDVGPVIFSWHPDGNFIASAGASGVVQITDRHGEIVDEVPMNTRAPILAMKWDKDGDYLAILQEGNCIVPLWSLANRRVIPMDTNLKDPSFLTWSRTGPQLAVGTAKGNLLIYNKSKKQKIPIVGKHSKAITCGDWSCKGNRLILGSDDNNITVSNEVGDTLVQMETKYASLEAKFLPRSDYDKRVNEHDRISCNLDGKALLLNSVSPNTNEDPIELTFGMNNNNECRYGSIVHHYWSDTDTVVIGFSGGHIVVVSTKDSEIGTEKQSSRFHPSGLVKFSYNEQLRRIASAGEDGVRIIDMSDFKEVRAEFTPTVDLENGLVTDLAWSPDGQILTIATSSGNVYNFLAKMSVLNSVYKSSISYLSSLREVSIIDTVRRTRAVEVPLKVEPSLIATGAKHVAAAMNNRVYFHRINSQSNSATTCNEQEYVGTVKGICLNQAYAVVLTDSKATLHPIEPPSSGKSNEVKTFPSREEGAFSKITCVALIDDFLYYGTEAGTVEIFYLNEWTLLSGCELRLNNGIKKIFPNHNGTRVIVVDSTNQIMLFNPIAMNSSASQGVVCIEHTLANIVNVFWDLTDKNVVMFYDGRALHTYVYASVSMKGEFLSMLGPVAVSEDGEIMLTPEKSELPTGNVPLISNSGKITCQVAASGEVNSIVHPYFQDIAPPGSSSMNERVPKNRRGGFPTPRELVSRFCQSLALLKLEDAWQTALELDRRHYWLALSNRAMELLNIDVALRVYRQLGDAGMVMALQQSLQMEDRHALAGNVALLFGDYSRAQELYLASGQPINALNMRKDLLQWDQALKLSQTLAPGQIPEICIRYGQQLEFKDETEKALHMYEMSLNATDNNGNNICPESLSTSAMSGVVRCNLHLGNIKQGIRLANELNEPSLYQEAGDILELHKQYSDAAAMYIKADLYEKAAYVYTKFLLKTDKSRISEAVPILAKVKNDQLNGAFGKACVAAGRYVEAAVAYERANDMDKVVELRLRHLDQTQEAFDLVRKTSSAQAALLVAEYCKEVCDYRGAIEFLLIANKSDEAFKVAQAQGHVETYTQLLGDQITSDDALKVAHFFEKNQDNGKAGKYYAMCGHYPRALKLFIQCGDREIDAAIEVVGKANSDTLTHQLIDFLVGEKDGVPKDPNYIYRLYMALKKYEDAAKTALIIAKQEQDMGNYHLARTIIYETIRQLEDCDINVPLQMRNQFVLLHSYEIAKSRIQAQDHMSAARLFLRVAQNVSKFPVHLVGILTATVIETKRAKLYASCYEYAVMLMSQHRKSIQPDEVRKSIEGIVRRKSMYTEDIPEETSLCPISNQPVEETLLECPTTRDAIPMCIITGKHMVLNDWCFCPNTHFPALYSEYIQYIQIEKEKNARNNDSEGNIARDPILNKNIDVIDIKLSSEEEARAYIKKYNNVKDDGTATQGKLSNYDNKEPSGNKNGKAAAGALQDKDHTSEKRSKKGVSFM